MIVKTEPRHLGTRFKKNTVCIKCGGGTREGKPYCPDHIDSHPYVQGVLNILAQQKEEQRRAIEEGIDHIAEDSLTVREIRSYLAQRGDRTLPRISKDLQLDDGVIEVYADYMVGQDIVQTGMTSRNNVILRLVG